MFVVGSVGVAVGVFLFALVLFCVIYDVLVLRLRNRADRVAAQTLVDADYLREGPLEAFVEVVVWASHQARCPSCGSYNTSVFQRGFWWDGDDLLTHLSSECSECRFCHQFKAGVLQTSMISAQQCYERGKLQEAGCVLGDVGQILVSEDRGDVDPGAGSGVV